MSIKTKNGDVMKYSNQLHQKGKTTIKKELEWLKERNKNTELMKNTNLLELKEEYQELRWVNKNNFQNSNKEREIELKKLIKKLETIKN